MIDDDDGEADDDDHQPQRHGGEPKAVTAFEVRRDPMNEHAGNEHRDYPSVLPEEIRDDGIGPRAADLVHHIFCRRPGYFICGCRVQVTGRAEEETREGDESKSLEYRPSVCDFIIYDFKFMIYDFIHCDEEINIPDGGTEPDDSCPNGEETPDGEVIEIIEHH